MVVNQSAKRVDIVSIKLVKEASTLYKNRKISSPDDVYELTVPFLKDLDREAMLVITLNTKNQPNSISVCSIGTINSSIVHPREIFKSAILSNAASIIIAHNHPSGDATESKEDVNISKRIYEAGKILGIELLDHLIIGDGHFTSLKERGIL
ncbi:JAB domain-containing protein [Anaerosolibacter sp.]|uniref:JAB domain-containing protein n=1 Tax=Anaerosolibacter sp. TaxID=1872527 RepID=UPI0039F07A86